ncbi:MAG: hypothetical protein RML36_11670 [Anaerolineae bacterium]|nr:hypothetical protein [Anaerolineae bacterium]MDW8100126.1 hypothetical protein [Anaerolineae bacterium]
MDVFNRLFAIVILLLILVTGVLAAAFPFASLGFVREGIVRLETLLQQEQELRPVLFVIGQIAAVLFTLLVPGLLLWLEMRRPRPGAAPVAMAEGIAQARVATDSVAQRLGWHLSQLADVLNVRPIVRASGRRVDVELEVETTPEIEVLMKTEEVAAVTREVVEDRMGLQLGKLNVQIRHLPASKT